MLTDRALVFEPNRLDHASFARGCRSPLAEVVHAVDRPNARPLGLGVGRAIHVEIRDGAVEIFRVADVDEWVRELNGPRQRDPAA